MDKEEKEKKIYTLEKAEVTYVPIEDLKPNSYNPNRQSDREFELLCRSIEEDGFTQPILAQKSTMEIIDGEHRWRACKALGWTEIPVVFTEMTREQMMIATLRHNRARGSEDISMAADVLRSLDNLGALDHAADSLLLSNVELEVMLEDIPNAELSLRFPGEKLTAKEVEDQIAQEREQKKAKEEVDKNLGKLEAKKITLTLRMHVYEKRQVEQTIEVITGNKKQVADGVVALCEMYKDDPEALAYMKQEDDEPLYHKPKEIGNDN